MNVLVFTTLYPNNVWPNHGVFVHERIRRVARLPGVSLRVVAPVPYVPGWFPGSRAAFRRVQPRETRDGINVGHPRYVMIPKIGMPVHGAMLYRSTLGEVRDAARACGADVIDAHYVYPDGYAAVRLGEALGLPVVVSARGSDINRFQTFRSIRPLLVRTLTDAAAVIAVSRALAEQMTSLGIQSGKIHVIPNGVDLERYQPVPKPEARATLGLPEGKLVMYVGNLVPGKGLERLIGAYRRVLARPGRADTRLVIVGRGPLAETLRQMSMDLGDRVRFAGEVPHDALADWYGAADLLCLPSDREGWPNVLLESMACGTPVVATRVGGIPEIVASGASGILTEPSEEGVAEGLAQALDRTWDPTVVRAQALPHTWDRAAASVLGVLTVAAAAGGAAGTVKVGAEMPIGDGAVPQAKP